MGRLFQQRGAPSGKAVAHPGDRVGERGFGVFLTEAGDVTFDGAAGNIGDLLMLVGVVVAAEEAAGPGDVFQAFIGFALAGDPGLAGHVVEAEELERRGVGVRREEGAEQSEHPQGRSATVHAAFLHLIADVDRMPQTGEAGQLSVPACLAFRSTETNRRVKSWPPTASLSRRP